MKLSLVLITAYALTTNAALAQTAAPGPVPGPQVVTTPDMTNAGSPRAPRHDEKIPGLSRQDRKQLRKQSKVKLSPDEGKGKKH